MGSSAGSALAADLKLEARLIWGTNDETSPNPDHKPVDAKTTGMLSKAFKWKKYFLVNSERVDVAFEIERGWYGGLGLLARQFRVCDS